MPSQEKWRRVPRRGGALTQPQAHAAGLEVAGERRHAGGELGARGDDLPRRVALVLGPLVVNVEVVG